VVRSNKAGTAADVVAVTAAALVAACIYEILSPKNTNSKLAGKKAKDIKRRTFHRGPVVSSQKQKQKPGQVL